MKIRNAMLLLILTFVLLDGSTASASENELNRMTLTGYGFGLQNAGQLEDLSDSANKVSIKNGAFDPSSLTVPVGTVVEWHNQDGAAHRIVSSIQGIFDSGVIDPGKKYSLNFNNAGTYVYYCSLHPQMKGEIIVAGATAKQGSKSASWSESPMSSSSSSGVILSSGTIADGSSRNAAGLSTGQSMGQPTGQSMGSYGQSTGQSISRGLSGTELSSSYGQTSEISSTSQTSLQKFSQYYSTASEAPEAQLTSPKKIELNEVQPDTLYFGSTQKAVPYTQYQTYSTSTGGNWLWISGSDSWTQYAMVPLGSMINLIAISPAGGYGYLYEIYPDGGLDTNSYSFYAYNQLGFYADQVGQHLLFFNIAGQPSNVIVVDVVPYQTAYPPVYDFAAVTIKSNWLQGYNVYVDGSFAGTEGMTGEPAGTMTVNVPGDQYHNIAIDGSGLTFSDYKYFKAGYAYQLNV